MTDATSEPIVLISEQADTETVATLETELAKAKASTLERRTLAQWLADPRPLTRLVCLLSDAELRRLLADERVGDWQIAVLPLETNRSAQVSFGVPANLGQALKGALEMENPTPIDLLTCNGQIMLGTLIVGNVWGLHTPMTKQNFWRDLRTTLGHLRSLQLQPFSITTGKGQKQDLAAMGVTVFGHSFAGLSTTAMHQALMPNDGKLNAFILSPTSVLSHLWFLLKLRFQRPFSMRQLPDSLGFIRSQSLTITSQRPLAATLDGQTMEASEWHIEARQAAAAVFINKRLDLSTEEGGYTRLAAHESSPQPDCQPQAEKPAAAVSAPCRGS
jgi:diacylglycerol kinase family enzyme